MNLLQMIAAQGPLAWLVLAILMTLSVLVWAVIGLKALVFSRVEKGYAALLDASRRSRFEDVRHWCLAQGGNPFARLFLAAARELDEVGGAPAADWDRWLAQREVLLRGLQQARRREAGGLRRYLPLLASAGNVSPFIGLFGTVWGIMRSFHQIGLEGSASLTVVAPGISEALLATAAGLFAAIPAVVAYNHFRSRTDWLLSRMDDVADEAISLLERERLRGAEPGRAARMER